jgi:Nucleotide modification associated domain 3
VTCSADSSRTDAMKIAMLRIGIDTGSGGAHGPLFEDGSFEFIPIPDSNGTDPRTYGNTVGRKGSKLVEYFPKSRYAKIRDLSIHADPEFDTFTYGDPTSPKAGLRRLDEGDMLVFYCGLKGWDFHSDPALYLIGYFEVLAAGKAEDFSPNEIQDLFSENFHVRHKEVFEKQRDRLVLVKGSAKSRLLEKAVLMSALGQDVRGKPLKILSTEMRELFGDFGGKLSFQRSPTRWVDAAYIAGAAVFVRSLP